MPDWVKFPVVLVIITLISALSLAYLQAVTEPARLAEEAAATKTALSVVLPDAKDFKEIRAKEPGKKYTYYEAMGEKGETIGYAISAGAQGYSSIVKVMVGMNKDYSKLVAIQVLSQKETPGLGDKINEILSKNTIVGLIRGIKYDETGLRPWFQVQFDGKTPPVNVKKDGGDIDAITGATITSRAVCKAANQAAKNLKHILK